MFNRDEAEMEEQIRASLQGTQGLKDFLRYDVIGASSGNQLDTVCGRYVKICEKNCLFRYVFRFSASLMLEPATLLRAVAKNTTSEG